MRSTKLQNSGFTLIELMIVVAVIAILAGIAYPSYIEHIRKTRRSAAAACLTERAQFMERFYTTNMAYNQDSGGAAVAIPNSACTADSAPYYAFDGAVTTSSTPTSVSANAYELHANPIGAQASDSCGSLIINQAGTKSVSTSKPVTQCF